ncbi:hypothetical protein Tcan_09329 [Toxocara canis]|uniref:C2H2-type domain-containing protein n=1 Tax=Toxocara canis TaxID=6265 RepID=A0A0B2VBR9_TOXCA|nr:hypothetical protein Tcan_09329 [Toxocara canis]
MDAKGEDSFDVQDFAAVDKGRCVQNRAALRGLCSLGAIMGDAFDEEEDRLMIDDAMLDPSAGSHAAHLGTNHATAPPSDTMPIPRLPPFTSPDDGVEKHPVDPEPKTTFFSDGAASKMGSSSLRDDLLKVTIRATHSPMVATFTGEKRLEGAGRSEESCKEEGEIDDEDESGNGAHSQQSHASSSAVQQNTLSWPSIEQDAGLDGVLNGTAKYGYATTQQQQHEHHALRSPHASHHPSHHMVVTSLPLSSVDSLTATPFATLCSPSSPKATLVSSKNVNVLAGVDESSGAVVAAALHRQPSQATSALRPPPSLPQAKRVREESEGTIKVAPAAGSSVETAGTSGSTSLPSCSKVKSKKKRRISGEESDGVQSAAGAIPGTSSNPGAGSLASVSIEAPPKRKKQITRDKSSNVSTKSVQTNEDDVEVTVGSTHCLDFTVLAKVPGQTSDSLYFVTNWNGRELYGILGDGMPPLHQSFQNKRPCVTANSNGDANSDTSGASHDRSNGGTPSKQRQKSQRSNRTSSVCTPNGSGETKLSKKGASGTGSFSGEMNNFGFDMAHEEEMSQSPVSWLCAGGTDPLYGVGAGSIGTTSGLAQLREVNSAQMMCCPVAGCGYYFETHAQLSMHYPHHFNQFRKAIYTEVMGSQTDLVPQLSHQDASTEPIAELGRPHRSISLCSVSTQTTARGIPQTASPSKDTLRPQLSNSEERSIHELFQVARRTNPNEAVVFKREFAGGHDSGGLAASKGFESRMPVGEMSKLASIPTALDAMEKMVSEGGLSSGEGVIGPSFSSMSQQHRNAAATVATGAAGTIPPSTSLAGSSHPGAGSPVFSDISDDAPTLEKEVIDKAEDRSSERVKLLTSTRSPLASLSLSTSSDKLCNVSSSGGELNSASLLCPVNVSSATSVSANAATRSTSDPATSTNSIATLSDAKSEPKSVSASSSSSVAPLIPFPPAIPPFVGLDPSNFPTAGRPSGGGASVASMTSMMYNITYMMPFGMSPNASGGVQSSTTGSTTSGTSKHKIHDLKTAALGTARGIADQAKDSTKLSPSMMTSPGTRSPSTNATAGRPSGGGASVASMTSMMYNTSYMMPFGMSPNASGGVQSSTTGSTTSGTSKHKIHDLKTAALGTARGIADQAKDSTKLSPSMMTSPGTRSPSTNATAACGVAGTSCGINVKGASQQGTAAAASQTPPSRPVTFLVGQQPPGLQAAPERGGPNVAAAALMQQQQQHQQQAHYLAQMQQQQMQQYMSQMRFAGGFPMMPPTNSAMAQQAYEQALVAMQAGMTPANFGLFAPQTFQPK